MGAVSLLASQAEGGDIDAIWDAEIRALEKLVLLYLADKIQANGGEFVCSRWQIAESVGLSVRAAAIAIKALETDGYIERLNRRGTGQRFMSNSYRLGKRFSNRSNAALRNFIPS
jgi:DNA-binding MarR family transcriptional regulator